MRTALAKACWRQGRPLFAQVSGRKAWQWKTSLGPYAIWLSQPSLSAMDKPEYKVAQSCPASAIVVGDEMIRVSYNMYRAALVEQ